MNRTTFAIRINHTTFLEMINRSRSENTTLRVGLGWASVELIETGDSIASYASVTHTDWARRIGWALRPAFAASSPASLDDLDTGMQEGDTVWLNRPATVAEPLIKLGTKVGFGNGIESVDEAIMVGRVLAAAFGPNRGRLSIGVVNGFNEATYFEETGMLPIDIEAQLFVDAKK